MDACREVDQMIVAIRIEIIVAGEISEAGIDLGKILGSRRLTMRWRTAVAGETVSTFFMMHQACQSEWVLWISSRQAMKKPGCW